MLSDPSPKDTDGQRRYENLLEASAEAYAEKGELEKHHLPSPVYVKANVSAHPGAEGISSSDKKHTHRTKFKFPKF